VLANASDIDHGATLDATLISSPSGTYGSLTAFNTDTGAYTYTLNNGTNGVAGLVQSLAQARPSATASITRWSISSGRPTLRPSPSRSRAPTTHRSMAMRVTTSPRTARKRQAASCLPTPPTIDHGATLDATLISSPSGTYGSLTAFNTDTGAYTYTLNNGTNGVAGLVQSLAQARPSADSFNYTVVDQFGATNTSTLTITITGTNDAPVDGDEGNKRHRGTARKRQAASCLPTPPTSITARRWMRR
jgi:VCBS repeat-containing protein